MMTLQVYRPSTASTSIRTGPKKRLLLDLLKKMGKEFIIISLDDLRAINVDKITQQLMAVTGFNKVIVNAVDYVDVRLTEIYRTVLCTCSRYFACHRCWWCL